MNISAPLFRLLSGFLLLIASPVFSSCSSNPSLTAVDEIALKIDSPGRIFSFTNKTFSQYSGETNSEFSDGWHGWTCREQRIFNDYLIHTSSGTPNRQQANVTFYPYKLVREFPGLTEEFFLPDSIDAVFINVEGDGVSGITLKNAGLKKFKLLNGVLSSALENKLPGYSLIVEANQKIGSAVINGEDIVITFEGGMSLTTISLSVTKSATDISLLNKASLLLEQKKNRINNLLTQNYIKTNDEDFNKAYLWAVVSADALVTTQQMTGIFAGLPWFNNYWGRDTFISLPGAALIPGNMRDARDILLSFAAAQNIDKGSKYFGRIPNRITLSETIYNTADGTPWWVIMADKYVQMTNDTAFIHRIYKNIKNAFDGAMNSQVDSYGFLLHDDADTWMDAVGPNGPWSPRGNRANDIQALWYRQLEITENFAYMSKDTITALRASIAKTKVGINFKNHFVDASANLIFDHLNPDGSPDKQVRPNLYTVLNTPGLLPDFRERLNILTLSAKELITPRGVLSLSFSDENFHPYHRNLPYYVKDAAYHNGIMWQWNNGPAISAMTGFGLSDSAWVIMQDQTNQILKRGAAGTLAELMDVLPKDGETEPALSGTFSQAWSLAEYIRNVNEDFLGVQFDAPANAVYLIPSLPKKLQKAAFTKTMLGNTIKILYDNTAQYNRITVTGTKIDSLIDIGMALVNFAGANFQIKTDIMQDDILTLEVPAYARDNKNMRVYRNGSPISVSNDFYLDPESNRELYNRFRFAAPEITPGLKSLRGPDYELLTHDVVKSEHKNARPLLSADDKPGDEKYQYPLNPNFKPGILDILSFSLSESDSLYHFTIKMKALSNPGWHNEYGFQLTLLSILIKTELDLPSNTSPLNSRYVVADNRAYSRNIVVGGGFEIRNTKGKVLAAYIPRSGDEKNPLGSIKNGVVSFSIPKRLLGNISTRSVVTVLCGAQYDHGGAGVGVFRTVGKSAEEWSGGGRKSDKDDLVYDILEIN